MQQREKEVLNELEKSETVWYICKPLSLYNIHAMNPYVPYSVFLVIQGQKYVFCWYSK